MAPSPHSGMLCAMQYIYATVVLHHSP